MMLRAFLCVVLAIPPVAASAEIFVCGGARGVTTYQNFPCEFRSLGSVPTTPPTPGGTQPKAPAEAAARARPAAVTSAAHAQGMAMTHASNGSVRSGMPEDDVRRAWGEPDEIVQDEPPSGRVDIWRYKDGRTVHIRRHRVVELKS